MWQWMPWSSVLAPSHSGSDGGSRSCSCSAAWHRSKRSGRCLGGSCCHTKTSRRPFEENSEKKLELSLHGWSSSTRLASRGATRASGPSPSLGWDWCDPTTIRPRPIPMPQMLAGGPSRHSRRWHSITRTSLQLLGSGSRARCAIAPSDLTCCRPSSRSLSCSSSTRPSCSGGWTSETSGERSARPGCCSTRDESGLAARIEPRRSTGLSGTGTRPWSSRATYLRFESP